MTYANNTSMNLLDIANTEKIIDTGRLFSRCIPKISSTTME